MRPQATDQNLPFYRSRFNFWYGFLLVIFAVFLVRLFYLQVIQHDYYRGAALAGQFKEYEIPAERGVIVAHDGDQLVPIVLNEEVFTVFADPKYVKNPDEAAAKLQQAIGGDASQYAAQMKASSRYSVLAKKVNKDMAKKVDDLDIKGLGTRAVSQRTYPQGALGAQLLGFVDDEGNGKYGVEEFLDSQLRGKSGELRAITDAQGVPLVANEDNVLREAEQGKRTTLTVDISMQRRLEETLKSHLEEVRSPSGSVIVLDPTTGAVKAMANYPSYNPSEFSKVEDARLFTNAAVSEPMEVGSVMKALTVAAGLNEGVITPNTTYYDPSQYRIGDAVVRNVEENAGAGTRSVPDILRFSLNTGATWVLMQLGGGELNEQGRIRWHNYLVDNFQFGKKTGIEQGYEAEGYIPSPTDGFGLDIQFANTTFGQGTSITPLQLTAAFGATINGGTYYRPHIVQPDNADAQITKKGVVSSDVSDQVRAMHENSVQKTYTYLKRDGYRVGGKTGTAEVPRPEGGYYTDRYNGTFIGYVGGDKPEYVIMVRVNEPKIGGYAGSTAAAPLFGKTMDMLISNYAVNRTN